MAWSPKEREVIQLLKDYNLKYPSGGQGVVNFEAMSSTYGSGWPLNSESLKRMGNGLVAETYKNLDYALTVLKGVDHPAYSAISHIYLVEEASPNDLEWYRGKKGSKQFILDHDRGIRRLAEFLVNRDLYVRWPEKHIRRAPRTTESHDEAHRLVVEMMADGKGKTESVRDVAVLTGLSVPTIWRILKARTIKS